MSLFFTISFTSTISGRCHFLLMCFSCSGTMVVFVSTLSRTSIGDRHSAMSVSIISGTTTWQSEHKAFTMRIVWGHNFWRLRANCWTDRSATRASSSLAISRASRPIMIASAAIDCWCPGKQKHPGPTARIAMHKQHTSWSGRKSWHYDIVKISKSLATELRVDVSQELLTNTVHITTNNQQH